MQKHCIWDAVMQDQFLAIHLRKIQNLAVYERHEQRDRAHPPSPQLVHFEKKTRYTVQEEEDRQG